MCTLPTTNVHRRGVTLLIVLALMVMFAMLVTAFMVIVSQQRRTAETNADILIHPHTGNVAGSIIVPTLARNDEIFKQAIEQLLAGSSELNHVLAPHSILENLLGQPMAGTPPTLPDPMLLFELDETDGKPFALRPNILAPNADGTRAYWSLLDSENVQMASDYTAPDFMTMFLAWNDFRNNTLQRIIPSFHRPQLVKYWQNKDSANVAPNELRKYVLRPLPTDHPGFTGSNPAVDLSKVGIDGLLKFLTGGPWDVDNDGNGIADGIWLDIGLPVQYDTLTKSWYKPLVSYYVIDMDGRINVNAVGNVNTVCNLEQPATSNPAGMGLGPAELSSDLLNENVLTEVLTERYGKDGVPGGVDNDLLRNNGINLDAYEKGGLVVDWFGTVPIDFDNLGNRITGTPTPAAENPYLMNPYNDLSGDKPFQTNDWESLVSSILETDYVRLPHSFRELLGDSYDPNRPALTAPNLRYNLATRSSNVPVAAKYVPVVDSNGIVTGYETLEKRAIDLGLWNLLPQEIRDGRKVNLNRLTLHPFWNIHWNSATSATDRNALIVAKFEFAQELFYLMRVLFPEQTDSPEALERLAQWSVNLVDFIDPDDVMTPFIFKTDGTPENNTGLISNLLTGGLTANQLDGRMLIWGFEKPEVALTETFALHDRKVKWNGEPLMRQFRQADRPQGSLFVEIYRQGDRQRTNYPADSVVDTDGTLNLAKKTANTSGDYVWRLAVGQGVHPASLRRYFKWNQLGDTPIRNAFYQLLQPAGIKFPQFSQWSGDGDTPVGQYQSDLGLGAPEQYIWFGSVFPSEDNEIKRRSFINSNEDNGQSVVLPPDSLLVVAPRLVTDFISGSIDLSNTRTMVATNPLVDRIGLTGGKLGVNVSEPLPTTTSETLGDYYETMMGSWNWTDNLPNVWRSPEITDQHGTIPCYKTICLQRLADPNRPHHPVGNPYLTVDWNMIDLQVFSDALWVSGQGNIQPPDKEENADPQNTLATDGTPGKIWFTSRQWKQETISFANLWDRTLMGDDLAEDKAGLEGEEEYNNSQETPQRGRIGNTPRHTLGKCNWTDSDTGRRQDFLHFPWHDAPLMNTGELMLVPASAPGRFGVEFHDNGDESDSFYGIYDWLKQTGPNDDKPRFSYHYDGSTFSPYPNWAGDNLAGTPATPSEMVRLFDFVHVPTKFAGTRDDDGYVFREPGKFNLNTITEEGWKALANGRTNFPSYDEFDQYRRKFKDDPAYPSEYKPFRSPSAVNLVPPLDGNPDALVGTPTSTTLLELENLIVNDADNPYMALENAMRLSDVTTARSNVFAVWMTVGYFEVEKFDNYSTWSNKYGSQLSHIVSDAMYEAVYPDGCVLGAEKGLNDGTVRRHRAFYLIDRSVPVGNFERGKKLDDINEVIIWETPLY